MIFHTAELWQSNEAFLRAFSSPRWTRDCFEEKDEFDTAKHNSCDNYNCQSVRLEARLKLKFKIPSYCYDHIASSPSNTCIRSTQCREYPDTRRTLQPLQKAFAAIKWEAISHDYCWEFYEEVNSSVAYSCDFDACRAAHEGAVHNLKLIVPEKCHHFIYSEPLECVKYDCNPLLSIGQQDRLYIKKLPISP